MTTSSIKHKSDSLAVLGFTWIITALLPLSALVDDSTESPYMELSQKGANFPLLSTDVQAEILDGIVKARVTQVYINRGEEAIEAQYVFPLSTRAAVHGMKMTNGDREIVAIIEEKAEAQKIYNKAKSEKKVASLLEQHRPNVFQTKVANILPGNTVTVEIEFTELLSPEEMIYEWVFPTVIGPRYSGESGTQEEWVDSPFIESNSTKQNLEQLTSFSLNATFKSSVKFKGFQSISHKPTIDYKNKQEVHVSLDSQQSGFQADRDVIIRYKLADKQIISGLVAHKAEKENFFLINVQPPERVKPKHIPNREYIFVVDVSGSMHGFPLDTTKELFENLAKNLRSSDRFNIMFFSGGNQLLSPESLPATSSTKFNF